MITLIYRYTEWLGPSQNYGLVGKLTALFGCSRYHWRHLWRIAGSRFAALLLINQTGYAWYGITANAGMQGLVDENITVDAKELIAIAALEDALIALSIKHLNAAVTLA